MVSRLFDARRQEEADDAASASFACGAWLHGKIDQKQRGRCSMWLRAMKIQRGPKLGEEEGPLAAAVHITSAGGRGRKEVATLAHDMSFVS